MLPISLPSAQDMGFAQALARVTRYLTSSKLHFTPEGVLELNPAPFTHAARQAGPCSPLAYAVLSLKDTCWEPNELRGRQILAEALTLWCQHHPDFCRGPQ